jgi:hypothetical protein
MRPSPIPCGRLLTSWIDHTRQSKRPNIEPPARSDNRHRTARSPRGAGTHFVVDHRDREAGRVVFSPVAELGFTTENTEKSHASHHRHPEPTAVPVDRTSQASCVNDLGVLGVPCGEIRPIGVRRLTPAGFCQTEWRPSGFACPVKIKVRSCTLRRVCSWTSQGLGWSRRVPSRGPPPQVPRDGEKLCEKKHELKFRSVDPFPGLR